ncbi:MAG: DNA primase [Candidatus Aminicenantes bacterium]|nr:DNA primase [Candidatus Aminicenantes bacterium]
MDSKDQIKEHISIVDVASLYVSLKPAGKNFKALCPFHTEKTPSFFVMPDKNSFSCFGCNRFGDIFTMVQEMENISFVEAMNFLAEKFNIPLEKSRFKSVKKDDYLLINELACEFFKENLFSASEGKAALAYLKNRGINKETIEHFALGYAPNSWEGLSGYLRKKGAVLEKALELGLLVKKEKNRTYDRFRGRIMFPIFSETGTLLAFGGRTIFDDAVSAPGATPVGAKYLNSPDSPIYKKGNHLFGFHLSKHYMKEEKTGLLVEGYLDMISLFQAGFRHVAASLGTALTEKQVHLLKRFCNVIHIFYDRDAAGEAATVRNIEKMFEQNVNPGIVVFEGAKDPDEFVRTQGTQALHEALLRTEDGFNFLLNKAAREFDLSIPDQKRKGLDLVMAATAKMSDPVIREDYIHRMAAFFKTSADLLKLGLQPGQQKENSEQPLKITLMEEKVLEALLRAPEVIPEIREFFNNELLAGLASRNIIRLLFVCYEEHGEIRFAEITKALSASEKARLNDIFSKKMQMKKDRAEIEKDIITSIGNFQKKMALNRNKLLNQDIAVAEREKNFKKVEQLMKQKNALIKTRSGCFREEHIEKET